MPKPRRTTEENIRALSLRATGALEGSEEFRAVMGDLRAGVKANAARGRKKMAALPKALPPSDAT